MKKHLQQIDVLKGLAIIAVILLHALTRSELQKTFAIYHIWQAVPIFMVLMGLNLGISSRGKKLHLQELYSKAYFQKKATRILIPFFIIFLVSIVVGVFYQLVLKQDVMKFSWYNLVGVLPVTGKGNYFITLLLQSILLLPLIGYGFNRRPWFTTVVLLAVEVAFLLLADKIRYFNTEGYLYDAALFRYLSALALGLWLSVLISSRLAVGRLLLSLGAIVSVIYLYFLQFTAFKLPAIRPEWQAQLVVAFPYAAFLTYSFIIILPNKSANYILLLLAALGRASYHIFLVQVIYFGVAPVHAPLLTGLATCLFLGYLFFRLEMPLTSTAKAPQKVAKY